MSSERRPPSEVQPGVWWLRGTRGCNVFLAEASDESLFLVDTGFASSAPAIIDQIVELGGGRPLGAILLTHAHADHTGAAAALRAATGARVIAGAGDCEEGPAGLALRPHVSRRSWKEDKEASVTIDCAVSADSEVLPGVRAVAVPGHTPGSLCFILERTGTAFAGDLVIIHGKDLTRPLRHANDDDAGYLASLALLAAVAPEACLPGHGPPMLSGFRENLAALAAMPRRSPLDPRGLLLRARRMAGFTRDLSRRR